MIHHADNYEFIRTIKSGTVDLILTDPPYVLDLNGGGKGFPYATRMDKEIGFMVNGFDYSIFEEFIRIAKIPNFLIFCSNNQISGIMSFFENKGLSTTLLIWKKTNPVPFGNGKYLGDTEFMIYVRGKNVTFNDPQMSERSKVFIYPLQSPHKRIHPTQKPLALIKRLIKVHSKEGDLIFDPFAGSGTTLIGAIEMNRRYLGCELLEEYYSVARKRILESESVINMF